MRKGERGKGRIEKGREEVCVRLCEMTHQLPGGKDHLLRLTQTVDREWVMRIDRVDDSCACVLRVGKGRVQNNNQTSYFVLLLLGRMTRVDSWPHVLHDSTSPLFRLVSHDHA
jgi:hypothetical protein